MVHEKNRLIRYEQEILTLRSLMNKMIVCPPVLESIDNLIYNIENYHVEEVWATVSKIVRDTIKDEGRSNNILISLQQMMSNPN